MHDLVWGVDVDSSEIAIGCWIGDTPSVWTINWKPRSRAFNGADDLERAHYAIADGIATLPMELREPNLIVVERPTGAHPKPALVASWGAVLLTLKLLFECPIGDVAVASWKVSALGPGHGHAKKPEIREWATARLLVRPSQNEADALGIGAHARTVELEAA